MCSAGKIVKSRLSVVVWMLLRSTRIGSQEDIAIVAVVFPHLEDILYGGLKIYVCDLPGNQVI